MKQLPLRDIHLPDPVSWWPLAPGWWLLLGLLIVLAVIVFIVIKRIRHKPLNKVALLEFKRIQGDYRQHQDDRQLVQTLSVLLRRVAMTYASRQQVASLTGQPWVTQLNALTEQTFFTEELSQQLITAPYCRHMDIQAETLLSACNQWLNALPMNKPKQISPGPKHQPGNADHD